MLISSELFEIPLINGPEQLKCVKTKKMKYKLEATDHRRVQGITENASFIDRTISDLGSKHKTQEHAKVPIMWTRSFNKAASEASIFSMFFKIKWCMKSINPSLRRLNLEELIRAKADLMAISEEWRSKPEQKKKQAKNQQQIINHELVNIENLYTYQVKVGVKI